MAGFGFEAFRHGDDLKQCLTALELVDAGAVDCSEDGYGLAAELAELDGDVGLLEVLLEAGFDLVLKLVLSEAGGVDAADQREVEVAAGINANGVAQGVLATDLVSVEDADDDLVVRAEDVGGTGFFCGGQTVVSRKRVRVKERMDMVLPVFGTDSPLRRGGAAMNEVTCRFSCGLRDVGCPWTGALHAHAGRAVVGGWGLRRRQPG